MPSATLITSVPTHVSTAEHVAIIASTPSSFGDIPPVLKLEQKNVAITLDPPLSGLTEQDLADGTLFVLTSVLVFMSNANQRGFSIAYPSITLHAISRAGTRPAIYCQLEPPPGDTIPNGHTNGIENENDEGYTDLEELTITPQDPESLETIFEALSHCSALHPDQNPGSDDDLDDDAFITDPNAFEVFTGDGDQELSEVGRAALDYLDSIIEDPHKLLPDDTPAHKIPDENADTEKS